MTGRGTDPIRRPPSTSTVPIARPNARQHIWTASTASCRSTAMPGSRRLTGGDIVLAACWAHARRKFYEIHQATGSPIAAEALRRIAELYAIEADDPRPEADDRQRVRGAQVAPARRCDEALAGGPAPAGPAARRPGRGHPLCTRALAGAVPVPRRWPHRARQQPGRARHPARRAGAQEPPVRRIGRWRRPLGDRSPRCSRPRSSTGSSRTPISRTSSNAWPTAIPWAGSTTCSRGTGQPQTSQTKRRARNGRLLLTLGGSRRPSIAKNSRYGCIYGHILLERREDRTAM